MGRVLIVVGLVALAFAVYSAVDCALTERSRVRALPRVAWFALIVLLPFVGGLLWFVIGAGRAAPRTSMRYVGPDDDPDFIRSSRTAPPAAVADEEWQRLEAELAAMDSESDTDDEGGTRRR